jgi:hypothetical protein
MNLHVDGFVLMTNVLPTRMLILWPMKMAGQKLGGTSRPVDCACSPGLRLRWGRDLAETMRNRFGLEIVFVSCLVTKQSISFEQDYNLEVTRHLDFSFGKGSFEKAYEEVQCRRKQAYDAWVAAKGLT